MQQFLKFLYRGFFPILYLCGLYGVLEHNNWSLDHVQIAIMTLLGFLVGLGSFINHQIEGEVSYE